MFRAWLKRFLDWTGDRELDQAIRRQLREQRYGVHAARIHSVRLVAIERPGWVQVRRFRVDTQTAEKQPISLLGLARDDTRKTRIEVLLSADARAINRQLDTWAEGLIRRG